MRSSMILPLLAMVSLAAVAGATEVSIPYSGQLVENGAPMSGSHSVTVTLWDAPTAGSSVHVQTEFVSVDQGVFHLDLLLDDTVFTTHDQLWAGVSVDGGAELEPRVRIGAVPYAVRSLTAPTSPAPGVSFATSFPIVYIPATITWTPIATIDLNAPAAGWVWLSATGSWFENSNTVPNYVSVEFILGENVPPIIDQHEQQTGFFQFRSWAFSHTTVLAATPGLHTYTCWARVNSPSVTLSGDPYFKAATMQAMWVPQYYGP